MAVSEALRALCRMQHVEAEPTFAFEPEFQVQTVACTDPNHMWMAGASKLLTSLHNLLNSSFPCVPIQ